MLRLGKSVPIGIIIVVLLIAPFYDVLRALLSRNVPFLGAIQEVFVVVLVIIAITSTYQRKNNKFRLVFVDYLVIIYILWNLIQVIQSPSILGGLYVWRWYSIGPFTYFALRLYKFNSRELNLISVAFTGGLVMAAVFILYQYFILGPEGAAQFSTSLGFTVMYRFGWRIAGSFGSPLVASASMSLLMICGSAISVAKRSYLLGLSLIGLGIVSCFLTLSRTGMVFGLIGIIGIIFLAKRKFSSIILVILLIPIISISSVYVTFSSIGQKLIMYTFGPRSNKDDLLRISTFDYILKDSIRHPLGRGFGGGGAVSSAAFSLFGGDESLLVNQNQLGGDSLIMATLQSAGWIGVICFIGILAIFIKTAINVNHKDKDTQVISLMAIGLFIGTIATLANLMDVWPLKLYLWLFGALVINYQSYAHLSSIRNNVIHISTSNSTYGKIDIG